MTSPESQGEVVVDMFAWQSAKFVQEQVDEKEDGEFDEVANALEDVYDDSAHGGDAFTDRLMQRIADEDQSDA